MAPQNIIIINGNEFSFEPGESILDVAQRNSIDIPTLCHLKRASPTGACRICVVEVEGARSLVASCAAPAANNMVVRTESRQGHRGPQDGSSVAAVIRQPQLRGARIRRAELDRVPAQGSTDEDSAELCPVWGDCRLQDLAFRYQVTGERFDAHRNPLSDGRRSIRLSCAIFRAVFSAADVSRPAMKSRSITPSISATGVRPPRSLPPVTVPTRIRIVYFAGMCPGLPGGRAG